MSRSFMDRWHEESGVFLAEHIQEELVRERFVRQGGTDDEFVDAFICEERDRNEFLAEYPVDRRLERLFAAACYEYIRRQPTTDDGTTQRFAASVSAPDGEVSRALAEAVRHMHWVAGVRTDDWREELEANGEDEYEADSPTWDCEMDVWHLGHILKAMVGPEWSWDPTWATESVVGLARGMYDSERFDAMPVLADALEDAGCDDEDLLRYCRGAGPFFRGSWVLDMATGRRTAPARVEGRERAAPPARLFQVIPPDGD